MAAGALMLTDSRTVLREMSHIALIVEISLCAEVTAGITAALEETHVKGLVWVHWLVVFFVSAGNDGTLTEIKAQLGQQMAMSLLQVGTMSLQRPEINRWVKF